MICEPIINTLYHNNPIAKAVVRDWTKVPFNVAAWVYGNEIGHTHIKYDEGNFGGSIAKAACKSSLIGIYAFLHPGSGVGALEGVSRISNYACEPVSRVFALISKDKQKEQADHVNYIDYAMVKVDLEIVIQAIIEGITKNALLIKLEGC